MNFGIIDLCFVLSIDIFSNLEDECSGPPSLVDTSISLVRVDVSPDSPCIRL